jgi:HlyD family type I secretion membrane fusion protein
MTHDVLTHSGAEALAPVASADWRGMLRIGHIAVLVLLGGFLVWALTARLDGAAVAPGVVETESSRKTIQHLEGGIVKEILVRNGDKVAANQLLMRLDPVRFEAQNDLYRNQLAILLAQDARLMAEYDMRPELKMPPEVMERAQQPSVAPVVADQERAFQSRREDMLRNVHLAQTDIDQARRDLEQTRVDAATATSTLESITQELDSLMPLFEKQLVTTSRINPLQREKLRLQGIVEGSKVQQNKLNERIEGLELKKRQAQEDYRKDASTQLIDVRKLLSDARQQIILADDSQKRTEIRAPLAGTVQQLKVFTIGGVVRPGDPIMDVIPSQDELVIQAQIKPDDADRVTSGMAAEIKFPAFNYWGSQVIRGHVRSISRDRVVEADGKNIYFASEIVVDRSTVPSAIEGRLSAGMSASVLVSTGKRTVAEYLVKPITERFDRSMRER